MHPRAADVDGIDHRVPFLKILPVSVRRVVHGDGVFRGRIVLHGVREMCIRASHLIVQEPGTPFILANACLLGCLFLSLLLYEILSAYAEKQEEAESEIRTLQLTHQYLSLIHILLCGL